MRIGFPLPDWTPPPPPTGEPLEGRFVRLERLDIAQADQLFDAFAEGGDALWTYMPHGPFQRGCFHAWIRKMQGSADPCFYAIRDLETGRFAGISAYLRIAPEAGSIEVGWLTFSPSIARSPKTTEAMFLMMEWAFRAGYRRYEWKCDALNLPSRRAAQRLGLSYEGTFRQATVYKQRNRDTAWFAAIDGEWPALETAFREWLSPANLDGGQKRSLSELTAPILVARDPALG
ncbi:GNAT family protein [Cereibacter sp. SYSU M97828]|nr:GNAT family protein [Cereibacter flavus]